MFEDPPATQILREEWQKISELLSTSYSDRVQKWRRQTSAAVGRLASVVEGTAKQLAPLRLLPLFESQDSIDQLVARARRNDPDYDYEPVDFSAWCQVETPAGVKAEELVKRLRKLDNVETAYVIRPNPAPMPVSFTNDPRNLKQGYQDAAPKGIDARYAWDFFGGDGAGIGFVDLEQGWNLNHRDLKDAKITIISGVNRDDVPPWNIGAR